MSAPLYEICARLVALEDRVAKLSEAKPVSVYRSTDDPIARMFREVEAGTGVTRSQLVGSDRSQRLVDVRAGIWFVLRDMGWTMTSAARLLNRDHTTLLNLERQRDSRMGRPMVLRSFEAARRAWGIAEVSR
jgi:hypothetical protein